MLASQWIVFVGITPLLFLFVYQVSLAAMPVNFIAIPWVSLTVVPPILVSMVLMPVSSSAAEVAGLSKSRLYKLLKGHNIATKQSKDGA